MRSTEGALIRAGKILVGRLFSEPKRLSVEEQVRIYVDTV